MSEVNCAACSTPYRLEQAACPHCGSTAYTEDGVVVSRRLPLLVSVSCGCGLGPWQLRLPVVQTGLIQLPELHCASCGSRVQIPWPPAEDDMPKITRHGGATNARATDTSPDVDASQLLPDGAEAVREERPTPPAPEPVAAEAVVETPAETAGEDSPADAPAAEPDYDGMTLAELREEATARGLAAYGTKAQITERLREADGD